VSSFAGAATATDTDTDVFIAAVHRVTKAGADPVHHRQHHEEKRR
jgi:hypothetical protein